MALDGGLVDWVAEQPESQLDRDGDPRLGMVGFSYGGAVVTAALLVVCVSLLLARYRKVS